MSNGSSGGLKVLKALVWVVYALASLAMIVIAFAFFLLLFDASVEAGFAAFIYRTAMYFVGPFVGMIEPTELASGGIVSWSSLFAIAAYAVLGALLGGLLNSISRRIYRNSQPAQVQHPAPVQPVPPQNAAPAPTPAAAPVAPAPVAQPAPVEPAVAPSVQEAAASEQPIAPSGQDTAAPEEAPPA